MALASRRENLDQSIWGTPNLEIAPAGVNIPPSDEVPLRVVNLDSSWGHERDNMLAIGRRNDPANVASRPFIRRRQHDNACRRKSGSEKSASSYQDEQVHGALNPLGPRRCLKVFRHPTSSQEQPECSENGDEQPEGIVHIVTIYRWRQWLFRPIGLRARSSLS